MPTKNIEWEQVKPGMFIILRGSTSLLISSIPLPNHELKSVHRQTYVCDGKIYDVIANEKLSIHPEAIVITTE